jgi:hypothetical protein
MVFWQVMTGFLAGHSNFNLQFEGVVAGSFLELWPEKCKDETATARP